MRGKSTLLDRAVRLFIVLPLLLSGNPPESVYPMRFVRNQDLAPEAGKFGRPQGLEISRAVMEAGYVGEGKPLNPRSMALVTDLTRKYTQPLQELLHWREWYYADLQSRNLTPGFLPEDMILEDAYGERMTVREIREGDWKVDEVPGPIKRAGTILTGPWADERWAINALGNRADLRLEEFLARGGTTKEYVEKFIPVRLFADNEDAADHRGLNNWEQKRVMMDVIGGRVTRFERAKDGAVKRYEVFEREHWPVITARTRGVHLTEKHLKVDGREVPGMIWDLVSYVENNLENLRSKNGHGAYVVIPKLQSAQELRLVTQMVMDIEKAFGLETGTIKIILMVETIELTLQLEEAVWAARKHVIVDNAGRWDMMATYIRLMWFWKKQIYPDVFTVTMQSKNMAAYAKRVVDIAIKRSLMPEGGMDVTMMSEKRPGMVVDREEIRNYILAMLDEFEITGYPPDLINGILDSVGGYPRADVFAVLNTVRGKLREAKIGFPSAWIATPTMVPFIQWIFKQAFPNGYEPIEGGGEVDYSDQALQELLSLPEGANTLAGVKKTIYYLVSYFIGARNRGGAVPILHPEKDNERRNGGREMDDFATGKINYYKVWTLMQTEPEVLDEQGKPLKLTRKMILQFVSDKIVEARQRIEDIMGKPDDFGESEWQIVKDVIKQLISTEKLHLWESIVLYAGIDETDPAKVTAITRKALAPYQGERNDTGAGVVGSAI